MKRGFDWLGFPEFKHWSPAQTQRSAREYEFGDGGILENLGVMPLLMRGVSRMIVFVNTRSPLREDSINDSIPPLFGQTPDFEVNKVFPSEDYRGVVDGLLEAKKNKDTVFHRARHRVLRNDHYSIAGGGEVDVLWVYNERVEKWESRLPAETRDMIGRGPLGNFPHYRTFLQNPPKVIQLKGEQGYNARAPRLLECDGQRERVSQHHRGVSSRFSECSASQRGNLSYCWKPRLSLPLTWSEMSRSLNARLPDCEARTIR